MQYGALPPQQYGAPPPQMMAPPSTNVVIVNQGGHHDDFPEYHGCCEGAMIHCDASTATCLFVLNIIIPSFGTYISSCCDRKGCNCGAFFLAIAQAVLV